MKTKHSTLDIKELEFWKSLFRDILDDIDIRIYFLLREDGRMTDTEIASRIGVSTTTVRRRRLSMQEKGYLQIIGILILQELDIAYADVLVKLKENASNLEIKNLIKDAESNYTIFEIAQYTGEYDILLRFFSKNLKDLISNIRDFMHKHQCIKSYTILPVVHSPKAFDKNLE